MVDSTIDSDHDGLTGAEEADQASNPHDQDSDADRRIDSAEDEPTTSAPDDGIKFWNRDSDSDGEVDLDEVQSGRSDPSFSSAEIDDDDGAMSGSDHDGALCELHV